MRSAGRRRMPSSALLHEVCQAWQGEPCSHLFVALGKTGKPRLPKTCWHCFSSSIAGVLTASSAYYSHSAMIRPAVKRNLLELSVGVRPR